jgi:hypothetical protein
VRKQICFILVLRANQTQLQTNLQIHHHHHLNRHHRHLLLLLLLLLPKHFPVRTNKFIHPNPKSLETFDE